jgi:glycosyltransferase involved in cell wall biosynthesis
MTLSPPPADAAGGTPIGSCCWLGTARYTRPLDPGTSRKWASLSGLGYRLHVIGFASGIRPRTFREHAAFHLLPALPFAPARHLSVFLLAPWLLLWIALRHDVRIVIAQSPYEGAIAAAAKMGLGLFGRRIALIVESHGDYEQGVFLYRDVPTSGPYRWLMRHASAFALRHADGARAVSSATERQIRERAPGLRVETFPAWIDTKVFRAIAREVPPSRCADVLFAGTLVPARGVDVLIEAFARLARSVPEARLVIAGAPGPGSYRSALVQRVHALDLDQRVTFTGEVPPIRLAELMRHARALVLPSISEGLGRVLLEAMLVGTPVVGSRVGGIPDVIRDGETGYLVTPGDVATLADALQRLFTGGLVDTMGVRARAAAELTVSAEAYVEGHRRVMAAARARVER